MKATTPIRVYADTSVFGGIFDDEFDRPTRVFFNLVAVGRLKLVTSALVTRELAQAPLRVRQFHGKVAKKAERAPITRAALKLREAFIAAGIVGPASLADALHVALAVVSECPVLVSWNCKHIVHFEKIPQYNAVSRRQGYHEVAIHTPLEIIET